jgi:hypothetical protein
MTAEYQPFWLSSFWKALPSWRFRPITPTLLFHLFVFHLDICNRYGFGVGGEYPMASASAAERSQGNAVLQKKRGQQVVLTFSSQVRPVDFEVAGQ